ncbi:POTRA domain-containing protein [Arenimonas sp.]|uniref:POTRA domain-containing protein n=1 Tax=Arenimonas sp. TaxID=1872635 RepID=UPI0039E5E2F9
MHIETRRARRMLAALLMAAWLPVVPALAQAPAAPGAAAPAAVQRTIQEIKFTGNKKLSTEQLSKEIGIKVGDVNTKEGVGGAMDKIVAAYKKIGSDLSLMVDISLPDPAHTVVNFLIDENGTGGNKGAAPRAGGAGGPPPGGAPPAAPAR